MHQKQQFFWFTYVPCLQRNIKKQKEHEIISKLNMKAKKAWKALLFKLEGYFSEMTKKGVNDVRLLNNIKIFWIVNLILYFSLHFFWNTLPI